MKSSRNHRRGWRPAAAFAVLALAAGIALAARGDAPAWLQDIVADSAAENALYRSMPMPTGPVRALRSPAEARPLIDRLVAEQPASAELHSLRAMEEERQLDFTAAERDWEYYAGHVADRTAGELALADFYGRRLLPADEIRALTVVAQASATPAEAVLAPNQQQSWLAFERIFRIIAAENLGPAVSAAEYRAWIARYPRQASLYGDEFQFLLAQKDFAAAANLIAEYHKLFPADGSFPVKASALLEYKKGNIDQALAIYDRSFQPLWPQDLVDAYFGLLGQTDSLRKFLDRSRAALAANPDDLNAMARVFDYYQQENKPDAARQAIDEFRHHKDVARSAWTAEQFYTLAELLQRIGQWPEAARYAYALYSAGDSPENRERALVELTRILLAAPEQPIRFGSGDLSLYKDIATMDPGPGYLNGILSLLFNSSQPTRQFAAEQQRAVPYFHRAAAARLLSLLDSQFPKAPERPALHAQLLQIYLQYGEDDAAIRYGRQFLADFPEARERTQVALLVANAFARENKSEEEFAMYDSVLSELSRKTHGLPLASSAGSSFLGGNPYQPTTEVENFQFRRPGYRSSQVPSSESGVGSALSPLPAASLTPEVSAGQEYSRVLEQYLARLAALHRIPQALAVLRREVERNPDDAGLYERLAQFLEQNQLGAQEEEVYRRAIAKFDTRAWYERLARFYLREKRDAQFAALTRQVVQIFAGTELQAYFQNVNGYVGPQLYLEVNLYAHGRFPHNLVFVRNLLSAYTNPATPNPAAWEKLLREHWFEDSALRDEFFQSLSRTGRLDSELAALSAANPQMQAGRWDPAAQANPAAVDFYAEAQLWRSHFENALPALGALADQYPADPDIDRRAAAVYRSLAYFEPRDTESAVAIEKNLLRADPGNTDILARIGDIYGDRNLLANAAPYWNRIAAIHPGRQDSYLNAATIFWDYYRFGDALRLLDEGRRRLDDPSLFAYQEGAIYENQREYARAIGEYVKGALAGGSYSQSENRLLALARRPKLAPIVDSETVSLAAGPTPSIPGLRLRLAVLDAQNKKSEEETLLLNIVDSVDSLNRAAGIDALARQYALPAVRERALDREAALTIDPVHRLQIRYQLAQLYEAQKDLAAAQREIEALYRENPKILGVVRATVDFYWRHDMRQQAIAVLLQAARASYPALRDQFDYEAARKATDAGQYGLARQLLGPLLAQKPYDGELLAAMADTFARAGDTAGLRDFYLAKIAAFRTAAGVPPETIPTLRRGLVPALTQLKDYTGAVDQYIEVINRYPEDEGLTDEAALYAASHGLGSRLSSYYEKTNERSPRDVRWAVVLARIETQLENYPAAIDSYSKAIAIRPDRVDLYDARADLLERLQRFDEAAADYTHLYSLTYSDPQWMRKVAEIRARQGRIPETVAALKTATAAMAQPAGDFAVAQALESWNLLEQAADFAGQGVRIAGADLLANPENLSGARLYVRILTRQRREQQAYAALQAAYAAATAAGLPLSITVQQVEREGLAAVTDAQWRERERSLRSAAGRNGMRVCLEEMAAVVRRDFTPEEKHSFAEFLASKRQSMALAEVEAFLIPAADAAGFYDLEASWLDEAMLGDPPRAPSEMQQLIALQSRRLEFRPLAAALESYAAQARYEQQPYILRQAADAYDHLGDDADELRIFNVLNKRGWLGYDEPRYYALLFAHDPVFLTQLARNGSDQRRDAATGFAVATGDSSLAYSSIRSRGWDLQPVWTNAYTGLVGLYYADPAAAVAAAFRSILDQGTIGDRLGKKVDLDLQLAGNLWFYYASRYGEYLAVTRQGDPDRYMPAALEQAPATVSAYLVTADSYLDAVNFAAAIDDFRLALTLSPQRADIRDRLALAFWQANQRSQAIAEWRQALRILQSTARLAAPPESLWTDFAAIASHLKERHLGAQFRPAMDFLLRAELKTNGSYRAMPLLQAAFEALEDPAAGVGWLVELSSSCAAQQELLSSLASAEWIPLANREPIYQRLLSLREAAVASTHGPEQDTATTALRATQVQWLAYLIDTGQLQRAQAALDALPVQAEHFSPDELAPTRLRLAAARNTLDGLLASYRANPDTAPSFELLRRVSTELDRAGLKSSADKILAFAYSREIEERHLTAANFLGLAEIRLKTGDVKNALALLNRLSLVVGPPNTNLDAAATLLEKMNHPAEAAVFLAHLVEVDPWDARARLRLAQAQLADGENLIAARESLQALAAESTAPYETRSGAAVALAGSHNSASLGSAELNLLASVASIAAAQANQPFFLAARLKAASESFAPAEKLALLQSALADWPDNRSARIQLFHAAFASGQDRLALSAISPLLVPAAGNFAGAAAPFPAYRARFRAMAATQQPNDAAFFPAESLPDRLRLASELTALMLRLDRLDDALRYERIAQSLEIAPAKRSKDANEISRIQAQIEQRTANASRRPRIHRQLDQARVVRPRLVAKLAAAAASAASRTRRLP